MKLLEYNAPVKPPADADSARTVDMQASERRPQAPKKRGWWTRFWRRAS
jgi:muconolactone delta-isomerase